MKITVLAENTSECGLRAEHGLSLFVETNGIKFLFDSGQTTLFFENAVRLGIDISRADMMILSHGHYDHGGGIKAFLAENKKAPVYMSRYAFGEYYNGTEKYIGLDPLLRNEKRIKLTDGRTPLGSGMTLYSCDDMKKRIDTGLSGLNRLENGIFLPDDFRHEHYLVVEENGKRILFSGCSHRGVNNIVSYFSPDVLIGGFHFFHFPCADRLYSLAKDLDGFKTEYYTCHCTGYEQYQFMSRYMRSLHYISTGQSIEL